MEYFGSRLVWSSLDNIVDPGILGAEFDDQQENDQNSPNPVATHMLDDTTNEIEYDQ